MTTQSTTTNSALESCRWCETDKPDFLDEDGTLVSITGKDGVLSHAHDDSWWPCMKFGVEIRCARLSPASAAPEVDQKPIDMILFCPRCGTQHIDAPEDDVSFRHRMEAFGLVAEPQDSFPTRWTNPPHKSHLCHQCGAVWRPADVATNGAAQIATRGERDTWTNSVAAPASTVAPVEQSDDAETMARLYTEASVVVDNLSTDLSALRSDNQLMRSVVDAAIAYTVEFETGMTSEVLQRLAVAVNAYASGQNRVSEPDRRVRLLLRYVDHLRGCTSYTNAACTCGFENVMQELSKSFQTAPASPAALRDEAPLWQVGVDGLFPCPFCGTPYPHLTDGLDEDNRWTVACCKCKAGVAFSTTKARAVELWNTRAAFATTPPSTLAKAAAEEIISAFPEIKEHDKWVTLGRVKIDIETETETFERATTPQLSVKDQIAAIISRHCFHAAAKHTE